MKFINKNTIKLNKVLNELDKFVIEFTLILNKLEIKYVLISGYVAILFGRSRSSEDVDILIEKMDINKFSKLWAEITKNFECIITEEMKDAYNDYLENGSAIRFSRKNKFIPNIELKFPKIELDYWTLNNKKTVVLNGNKIYLSPIELQVPYKLFLGTEKDIEDAKFLYNIFKNKIDLKLLTEFNRKLKIEDKFKEYLE